MISHRPFVVVCNPGGRRADLLRAASAVAARPLPRLVPYAALLRREKRLVDQLPVGCALRFESPGEDWEVERELLAWGAEPGDTGLSAERARALAYEHGRFRYRAQAHRGFARLLRSLESELSERADVRMTNTPDAILAMCDKARCRSRLARAGVPIPPAIKEPDDAHQLREAMAAARFTQVFVKPRFGSAAAGVIAFRRSRAREVATTTLEIARPVTGATRFFNSIRLRKTSDRDEITSLLDTVCAEGAVVEQWIPKFSQRGRAIDFRVLCFGGTAHHMVMRTSQTPITNLHLGNARGDIQAFRRSHPVQFELVRQTAERAAACFAGSLSVGVDVMLGGDTERALVLEANAFGELLPRVMCDGEDTYTTLLRHTSGW